MSKVKCFYENIAFIIAKAFYEEDPDNRDCYKCETLAKTEELVLDTLFDGDIEDMFSEMKWYVSDFREDLTQEFPLSFSAMTIMAEISEDEDIKQNWTAIIKAASEPELFRILVESYKEYYDMADPSVSEAKDEIIRSIFSEDYEELLTAWKENIEWRELTESEYPKTFHAVEVLENIIRIS